MRARSPHTLMNPMVTRPNPDEFRQALVKSLIAHGVLLLIFTVRALFFTDEPLRLESAIRVDIVGLPDKVATLPPLEENQPPAEKITAPPPPASKELPPIAKQAAEQKKVILKPTKPDPKAVQKNQNAALKRLDAMKRLEEQARADNARKAFEAAKAANAQVKGNQISRGSALSGLTRLDHARYLNDLEARIRASWHPPKFLAKAGLRVRVVLLLDQNGGLLKKTIVQSSGNGVFDESAISAIEESLPLPPPPANLRDLLASRGVELDLEPAD